jgi:hypothetical protein
VKPAITKLLILLSPSVHCALANIWQITFVKCGVPAGFSSYFIGAVKAKFCVAVTRINLLCGPAGTPDNAYQSHQAAAGTGTSATSFYVDILQVKINLKDHNGFYRANF